MLALFPAIVLTLAAPRAQESTPALDRPPTRQTQRPPLHATEWLALTGKPLAATAGALMFKQGGNAIDAACAMLAATHRHRWPTLASMPSSRPAGSRITTSSLPREGFGAFLLCRTYLHGIAES